MKFPCKNCICFPICKPKYHFILNSDLAISEYSSFPKATNGSYKIQCMSYAKYRLAENCKLLEDYIYLRNLSPISIQIYNPFHIWSYIQDKFFAMMITFRRWRFDEYFNR